MATQVRTTELLRRTSAVNHRCFIPLQRTDLTQVGVALRNEHLNDSMPPRCGSGSNTIFDAVHIRFKNNLLSEDNSIVSPFTIIIIIFL